MAGARTRKEYYWIDDRIIVSQNYRPSGHGRWPRIPNRPVALRVLTAEVDSHDYYLEIGPAGIGHRERETTALLIELGLGSAFPQQEIGYLVPEQLVEEVKARTEAAVARVTRRYRNYNEVGSTGALFETIAQTIKGFGWNVTLEAQEHSGSDKEGVVGADGGIILDVQKVGGPRMVKAFLVQSKKAPEAPSSAYELPRVGEQLGKMREFTQECYVLVFTPEDLVVYGSDGRISDLGLGDLLGEGLRCRKGDPDPRAVGIAHHLHYVLQVRATVR